MDPSAGLDMMVRKNIPSSFRDSNPHHPARRPALYQSAIPAPHPKISNDIFLPIILLVFFLRLSRSLKGM
jgi:hypothetical protein